jgi:hypothetical protein
MNHESEVQQLSEVDRRRFLTAGALGVAAWSTPSVLRAQGGSVISPVVFGITPRSGAEGTQVLITGSGFDPNPANNSVLFGKSARGEVLQATATQLVVKIGPVAATGTVTLSVVSGIATPTPQVTITQPPATAILLPSSTLCGSRLLTGPQTFDLTIASPQTLTVDFVPATQIEIPITDSCADGDSFSLYLHVVRPTSDPCIFLDSFLMIDFSIPGGTAGASISPFDCAKIIAACLQAQLTDSGYTITAVSVPPGAKVVITRSDLRPGSFAILTKK